MREKSVKLHNKFQFEIKLGYKINQTKDKTSYDIDTYFFIPNNLGINSSTYSKNIFFKDIHSYIRLKTPTMLLRQIANPELSPLSGLKESIKRLLEKSGRDNRENFEYHVKMFCSIVKSALRDHVSFTKKSLQNDKTTLVREFVSESSQLVKEYRNLKPLINVPTSSEKSLAIFRFGDEFISKSVELYSFKLLKLMDKINPQHQEELKENLAALINNESAYRIACDFHPAPSEEHDNETLIYRRGVLKKYIGSVLFLDTEREPEGKFLEQFFMGLAAGLAMVFATLVAFYAQSQYGNFTLPVFALLVVSYIFKDRIKELSRIYFVNKVKKFRFDHKTDIFSDERKKIGTYKDAVNFVDESDLPQEVKKIRKKDHIADIDNSWRGEKIIFYRKQVTLFAKRLKKVYKEFDIDGVNDIMRFNVSRFLSKMDNPSRKVFTLNEGEIKELPGSRVYRINLIIKVTRDKKITCTRYRIILTRDGIKRIDDLSK
ncbi:MAG: hypothetical protein GY757_38380 [bacterium]|nr:hypothetical protein [bacterium]